MNATPEPVRHPWLIVARREIERLENLVAGREAAVAAVVAAKSSAETRISTLLPDVFTSIGLKKGFRLPTRCWIKRSTP